MQRGPVTDVHVGGVLDRWSDGKYKEIRSRAGLAEDGAGRHRSKRKRQVRKTWRDYAPGDKVYVGKMKEMNGFLSHYLYTIIDNHAGGVFVAVIDCEYSQHDVLVGHIVQLDIKDWYGGWSRYVMEDGVTTTDDFHKLRVVARRELGVEKG